MMKCWIALSSDLVWGEHQPHFIFYSDFTQSIHLKLALEILCEAVQSDNTSKHTANLYSSYNFNHCSLEKTYLLHTVKPFAKGGRPSPPTIIIVTDSAWRLYPVSIHGPTPVTSQCHGSAQYLGLHIVYLDVNIVYSIRDRTERGVKWQQARVKYKLRPKTNHILLSTFTETADFCGVRLESGYCFCFCLWGRYEKLSILCCFNGTD